MSGRLETDDERLYREDQERLQMEQRGLGRGVPPVAAPHSVSPPAPIGKLQQTVQDAIRDPRVTNVALTEEQELAIAEAKTQPPVNMHVPYVAQMGPTATCTMGEWLGEPETYAYAWEMDGASAGTDAPTLDLVAEDIGKTVACIVSATNEHGTTAAPVSNAVVIA